MILVEQRVQVEKVLEESDCSSRNCLGRVLVERMDLEGSFREALQGRKKREVRWVNEMGGEERSEGVEVMKGV